MQIIYRASDIVEAHIVSGMLNAQGIETYVGGHYLQGAVGDLSPLGFANVFVSDDDFDSAMPYIKEYENNALNTEADHSEASDMSGLTWRNQRA